MKKTNFKRMTDFILIIKKLIKKEKTMIKIETLRDQKNKIWEDITDLFKKNKAIDYPSVQFSRLLFACAKLGKLNDYFYGQKKINKEG